MKLTHTPTTLRSPAWYGWLPDLPDQRDHVYAITKRAAAKLPPRVDMRVQCSAIEDQGALGSCTANALVGALEFLEIKSGASQGVAHTRVTHSQAARVITAAAVKLSTPKPATRRASQRPHFSGSPRATPALDLSRLFVYYNERVIEHSVAADSGAMLRDGIKSLAKQGVCAESLWPYNIAQFAKKPTPACYTQGLQHTISSYQRLSTTDDMRSCLAGGVTFVFGFTVYESFESATVAKTGNVPMPRASERTLGGHAVCAVGYDDATKRFICRNSWGIYWGQKGYFTIPYAYLANRNLSDDFWTITK